MDAVAHRADQVIDTVRIAWRTQRQQLQILGGALLLLLTIVLWERNQWIQQPRSDLLQDLPQAAPETLLEYALKTSQSARAPECWHCSENKAFFDRQQLQLTQLRMQTDTLCHLANHSKSADGTVRMLMHAMLIYMSGVPSEVKTMHLQVVHQSLSMSDSCTQHLGSMLCLVLRYALHAHPHSHVL